jgi:hypothetical protein
VVAVILLFRIHAPVWSLLVISLAPTSVVAPADLFFSRRPSHRRALFIMTSSTCQA